MYQVPLDVYEQLEGATPEDKRHILLTFFEEHLDHWLELPERDGVCADLSGVDLSRAALQKIVDARAGATPIWWALLINANLQGANLFSANLQDASLFRADLRGADLGDTDLRGADLRAADLQGASLSIANLQGADLRYADLQGANLRDANLEHSDLRRAKLQGVDLSTTASMRHCYLSGAWLDRTRLRREQLGGPVGEELDGDYRGAKLAYLGLKQNFSELGDYAAASWAYCRERRMEKHEALKNARDAHARRDWKRELFCYRKVLIDQMVELVCDYGEGVWRVLVCLVVLWFDSALIYGIMGHVLADRGPIYSTTRNLIDLLSFSLATMVTLEVPGLRPFASLAMRILMPLEAALGIFFLGLLGFVAGNRIRRS